MVSDASMIGNSNFGKKKITDWEFQMPKHEIPLEEQAMRSPDARNWNGQSALKLLTVESACANLAAIIPGGATSRVGRAACSRATSCCPRALPSPLPYHWAIHHASSGGPDAGSTAQTSPRDDIDQQPPQQPTFSPPLRR